MSRCAVTAGQIAEYRAAWQRRRDAVRAWKTAQHELREASLMVKRLQERDGIDPSPFSHYVRGVRGKTAKRAQE